MSRTARVAVVVAVLLLGLVARAPGALASHTQESLFQDDLYLLYKPTPVVNRTLSTLHSLGVNRVRITMKWSDVAPAPLSTQRPPGFNASDPGAYPSGAWTIYDRIVELSRRHGIGVEFNLTVPGPLWAMRSGAPTAASANHWAPDSSAFQQFVTAVGTRYSGQYSGLPRVSVWSIWNEPNQPGWLAPQSYPSGHGPIAVSAWIYRLEVEAGLAGLYASGHGLSTDTILIGELAPEGYEQAGNLTAMTPMRFLRALYCVDGRFRRLRGKAASSVGCPTSGSAAGFVRANPGLFYATGFAHHPYYFFFAPSHSGGDPNYVPMANLGRLKRGLDHAFATYDVRRRIPIYLTEYGYQTRPPDPYQVVSLAKQARYLNQADYLAWRDPRVRSVAQFLLRDSPPNTAFTPSDPQYWDSFQTGLEFANGRHKPSYAAYRMPIWIPSPNARRVFVWGQLRSAREPAKAVLQWARPHGRWRTLARVQTRGRGFVTARVRVPRRGVIRLEWGRLVSRGVAVG